MVIKFILFIISLIIIVILSIIIGYSIGKRRTEYKVTEFLFNYGGNDISKIIENYIENQCKKLEINPKNFPIDIKIGKQNFYDGFKEGIRLLEKYVCNG